MGYRHEGRRGPASTVEYETVKGKYRRNVIFGSATGQSRKLWPAIAVVGSACGLAATQASALELGDVRMESTLGQPLRASIAYALNPNEQLYDFCIYLRPGVPGGAIPTVSRAGVSVAGNKIILTGNTAIKDPLLNLKVAVDCPYTPNLVREYTLIVDPVLPVASEVMVADRNNLGDAVPQAAPVPDQSRPVAAAQAVASTSEQTEAQPIAVGSQYAVVNGDTVSLIATRIEGRVIGLWPAINALVAANPGAFADGDADRLMSGSLLTIPDLSTATVEATVVPNPVIPQATQQTAIPAPHIPEPAAAVDLPEPVADTAVQETPAEPEIVVEMAPPEEATSQPEPVAAVVEELRAGDIIMPVAAEPVIPEPETDSSMDSVPTVAAPAVNSSGQTNATSGAWSWLIWLVGGGLALIIGLALFGRKIRGRFGSVAIGRPRTAKSPTSETAEEATEEATEELAEDATEEAPQSNAVVDDVDFRFDDTNSEDAISLDADLDAGTGLQGGADINVAQDYGFTPSDFAEKKMDLEITEEAAGEPGASPPDIVEPHDRIEESSILEAEVAPEDEEYDMSMIVDATKQSIGDDDSTARDLQAFQVRVEPADDQYSVSDGTLNTEVDLQVLEQDYQEEFTQTQALNKEIEEAARALAEQMTDQEDVAASADGPGQEPTAEMPVKGADPGLEPTAEMPVKTPKSDITAEVTAKMPIEMDAENDDIVDTDVTSKLATAGSDVTVEMQVESGKVDTKKNA